MRQILKTQNENGSNLRLTIEISRIDFFGDNLLGYLKF